MRPTKASDKAGMSSTGMSSSAGSCRFGSELGTTPRSLSVATSVQPSASGMAEVATTAITRPNGPSRVRSRTMISAIVAIPTANVARWISPGLTSVLSARTMRFDPSAAYPVISPSWPSTMLTPIALMKPTITALETKRRIDPSLRRPAASMTTPVSTASVNRARAGSMPSWTAGTSRTIIAIAPVPWMAMNDELVARAPAVVPTR